MLTQDQKSSIGGLSIYQFEALIGESSEIVTATIEFEYDSYGPYNEYVKSVIYNGVDIVGCLTLETLNSIEINGIYKRDAK
jgi:hypothetical protein